MQQLSLTQAYALSKNDIYKFIEYLQSTSLDVFLVKEDEHKNMIIEHHEPFTFIGEKYTKDNFLANAYVTLGIQAEELYMYNRSTLSFLQSEERAENFFILDPKADFESIQPPQRFNKIQVKNLEKNGEVYNNETIYVLDTISFDEVSTRIHEMQKNGHYIGVEEEVSKLDIQLFDDATKRTINLKNLSKVCQR